MAFDTLVQPLRNLALFQGLSAAQLTEIARRAERVVYRAGDRIITEDATADAAIIIVAGEAHRTSGPDLDEVEVLPVGALLGEMGMLVETTHTSTVVAVSAVRALRIQRAELMAQMARDQSLAEHFVRLVTERLHEIAEAMRAVDRGLAFALGDEASEHLAGSAVASLTNGTARRAGRPGVEESAALH